MPVDHYENFPVASILLPRRLRPPVEAIYAFARSADDIADEGDASPAQRLASLQEYDAQLDVIAAGGAPQAAHLRNGWRRWSPPARCRCSRCATCCRHSGRTW